MMAIKNEPGPLNPPSITVGITRPKPARAPRAENKTAICIPAMVLFRATKPPSSIGSPMKAGIKAVTDCLLAPMASHPR